jgi:uncharacterized protein (TIGR02285 family)
MPSLRRVASTFTALCLALAGPLRAQAPEERIVWVVADGPPYHVSGAAGPALRIEDLGQGSNDRLMAELARELPQFRHEILHISRSRLWKDMRAGEPRCYSDAFKTPERLAFAHFSSVAPSLPMVVVTRPGTLRASPEGVSLHELLSRAALRPLFEAGRSYGPLMDAQIKAAGAARAGLPSSPQVLHMLLAGRMDYLIEYPMVLEHYRSQLKPAPVFDYHALLEERDPQPTHVACTRGPWGLKVIEAVDAAVRRLALRPETRKLMTPWLPDEVAQSAAPVIERFYRERAGRSDIE